jgi:branched-chain amino acid transport system ATP-binding protein
VRTGALAVEGLALSFGGVKALDGVSFAVAPGSIHALIGPNGAGKSTCFNVICGVYRPDAGRVRLHGEDVTSLRPHQLAGRGLGRSFQNLALSAHSTVLDNVMLARHCRTRGGFLAAGVRWPAMRREQAKHSRRAVEICEFLGIGPLLHQPVGGLSYGDSKRVDIARALATEPSVLLLDEPAAGMNAGETAQIAELIVTVREALEIPVLLVEHDMTLVMGVADRITVLDFGKIVADGTPTEIRHDPEVIRAYLGTEIEPAAVEAAAGGSGEPASEVAGSDGPAEVAGTGTGQE